LGGGKQCQSKAQWRGIDFPEDTRTGRRPHCFLTAKPKDKQTPAWPQMPSHNCQPKISGFREKGKRIGGATKRPGKVFGARCLQMTLPMKKRNPEKKKRTPTSETNETPHSIPLEVMYRFPGTEEEKDEPRPGNVRKPLLAYRQNNNRVTTKPLLLKTDQSENALPGGRTKILLSTPIGPVRSPTERILPK